MPTVKEMMEHIFSSDEEEDEGGILDKYQPLQKKCWLIPSPTALASHSALVSHTGAIQKACPGIVGSVGSDEVSTSQSFESESTMGDESSTSYDFEAIAKPSDTGKPGISSPRKEGSL